MNDYYLEHHGILGQKWGIRRFQNEDGTRTNAGKRRYRDSEKRTTVPHDDYLNAHSGKSMNELSTKELQATVTRLNFEQQYRNLNKSTVNRGRKTVGKFLSGAGELAIAAVPVATLIAAKTGKNVLGATAAVSAVAGLTKVIGDILKRD